MLEAAFSQIPKHCCVLVTSRSEPPAVLARLRVTGEMVCIGAENLHSVATPAQPAGCDDHSG